MPGIHHRVTRNRLIEAVKEEKWNPSAFLRRNADKISSHRINVNMLRADRRYRTAHSVIRVDKAKNRSLPRRYCRWFRMVERQGVKEHRMAFHVVYLVVDPLRQRVRVISSRNSLIKILAFDGALVER